MAKKTRTSKKAYYRLGGQTLMVWGAAQALIGASSLTRTLAGLRGFSFNTLTTSEQALVGGVLGADALSYLLTIVFGVLLVVLGKKLVK